MNHSRRIYNNLLSVKFSLMGIDCIELSEEIKSMNQALKDLDEMASRINQEPQNYIEFVTGKGKGK